MSDRYGLIISEDGQTVKESPAKLDSRRSHIIVDLERTPSHLQLIVPTPAATALANDGIRRKETLKAFDHNLLYAPLVFAYFQLITYTGSGGFNSTIGDYSGDYYNIGGTGSITDFFSFEVDKTQVRIIHLQDGPAIGYVSEAPKYFFRVKLYICSVDTGRDLYDGLDALT